MANADTRVDYLPKNYNVLPTGPSIAQYRTALAAYNSTSYSSTRLDTMTERDMRYALDVHGIAVTGE